MLVVLHPEQAEQVQLLALELEVEPTLVVAMLLSGPLMDRTVTAG